MRTFKFGGYGVDVRIHGEWEPGVVWGPRPGFASYVLVEPDDTHRKPFVQDKDGNKFHIVSVNGIGEIRWFVSERWDNELPMLLEAFDVEVIDG